MNKEEILKASRADNEGQLDEREKLVLGIASRAGIIGGVTACCILSFISKFLLDGPEAAYAGWFVYAAVLTVRNIVLYINLKKTRDLLWALVGAVLAVLSAAALIMKWQVW